MVNIEKLIEAVSYSFEEGQPWWEIIGSKVAAVKLLKDIKQESVEEEHLLYLSSLLEETDVIFTDSQETLFQCLKILRDSINEKQI